MSQLHWRCRRGMRELDQLLARYLDQRYAIAPADERLAFQRLLDCEDDHLWNWLLARETPPEPELASIVRRILSLG